ncbi:MAG: ATP-binding protein, partial [Thermodesulfobacteriota bacterium]
PAGQRIDYVRRIPDWQWVVGAGMYLDDVDAAIAEKAADLHNTMLDRLKLIAVEFALLLFVLLGMLWFFQKRLRKGFDSFLQFFQYAAHRSEPMDPDQLHFQEFQEMARAANQMMDQRSRAEAALRRSEIRYRSLIENISDAVLLIDDQWQSIIANKAAQQMLRHPDRGVEQIAYAAFWPDTENEDPPFSQMIARVIDRQQPESAEAEVADRAGGKRWYAMTAYPVPEGVLLIITDVTTRKLMENRRGHEQKMAAIGTLTGGIAHNFNNLLAIISGYTELLMDECEESGTMRQNLAEIQEASRRGSQMIRQLTQFRKEMSADIAPIDPAEALRQSLGLIDSARPGNIGLVQDIHPLAERVMASRDELHQMVINLLLNAFAAIGEQNGTVEIRLDRLAVGDADAAERYPGVLPGAYARIRVQDDGPGMAPAELDRIFEPYYSTQPVNKGAGLGLSVVYGIVERYNGHIFVESEPDNGTRFTILLPLAGAEDDTAQTPET